jgi:hypothetical protein
MTTIDYTAAENDWEEPEETALRQRLGVRPTLYVTDGEDPDARPCPAWCHDGHDTHDIHKEHPLDARHALGYTPRVVASRYRGEYNHSDAGGCVTTAHIDVELQQIGQAGPHIELGLHHYPNGQHAFENRLEVSVEDARDLARALTHLADVAEGIGLTGGNNFPPGKVRLA